MISTHTQDGKSVMEQVATGGGAPVMEGRASEQIPLVFRIPHHWASNACVVSVHVAKNRKKIDSSQSSYSLLGFGDVLVPGLLVGYCHAFDLQRGTPCRVYYVVSLVGETVITERVAKADAG